MQRQSMTQMSERRYRGHREAQESRAEGSEKPHHFSDFSCAAAPSDRWHRVCKTARNIGLGLVPSFCLANFFRLPTAASLGFVSWRLRLALLT